MKTQKTLVVIIILAPFHVMFTSYGVFTVARTDIPNEYEKGNILDSRNVI